MKKLQNPPAVKIREKKQEPLAEGLQVTVPTDSAGRRLWRKMNDEEIVEYAKRLMKKKKITEKGELVEADNRLYEVLRIRGLLGDVVFESGNRSWKDWSNEEIVEFAQKVMEEKKITSRGELSDTDSGLYNVLGRRGLLDGIEFEEKRGERRSWDGMADEEIVEYARRFMEENGISGRSELQKNGSGLYGVLYKRGLLGKVGFEEKQRKHRPWKDMSDEEVVEYARRVMEENGITGRKELITTDSGLYQVLRRRGLLDRVFALVDQERNENARDAVIDALEAFSVENDNGHLEDDAA